MNLSRVALVVHPEKPRAAALAGELSAHLADRGIETSGDPPDIVVALGGDGTMLRAAQLAHGHDVPVIGVNLGALGYLTEVDAGAATAALDAILAGAFRLEPRVMLECAATGPPERRFVGLNEVLVERSSPHRLVNLDVSIGGERLTRFNADGMIVATPTGSTAYALSAGGPIVAPSTQCLILVPVSAHMLFSRTFVLPPDEVIEIRVGDRQPASLSLDGVKKQELPAGCVVVVRRHSRPLRLVRLGGPDFLARLRTKLDLPG